MMILTSNAAHSGATRTIEKLNVEPHPPRQLRICMVWGLFKGGIYFILLEPDDQCGNNSRAGRIQGNMVISELQCVLTANSNVANHCREGASCYNVRGTLAYFILVECAWIHHLLT